jgi:hypothetical protein
MAGKNNHLAYIVIFQNPAMVTDFLLSNRCFKLHNLFFILMTDINRRKFNKIILFGYFFVFLLA